MKSWDISLQCKSEVATDQQAGQDIQSISLSLGTARGGWGCTPICRRMQGNERTPVMFPAQRDEKFK